MNNLELIKEKLIKTLNFIGVDSDVSIYEEGEGEDSSIKVDIQGNNLSFLIGYRGDTLSALQNILGLMLFTEIGEWQPVVVDVNNYRKSRKEKIEDIAKKFIDRVRFSNQSVELPTMNSFERRQIHMFITGYDDIVSESVGEGKSRRIVLSPKN